MDEIDWAAEDLSHLKLTASVLLERAQFEDTGNKKNLIKRIKDFQMLGH